VKLKILNKWFVWGSIGLLFLFTRLYQINTNPPALYWDEASIGVNAYSILITGKDEWGTSFPLHFRAFGEFKLPVYIYTVAGFMSVLGKKEIAVRLPAVLFTAIAILFSFLIYRKVLGSQLATLGVFFLTMTPWLFLFSRTGYEVTAGLAFFMAGLFFFLKSLEQTSKVDFGHFLLAHLFFGLALYSYNSYRVILPVALPLFYIYLWRSVGLTKTKLKAIFLSLFLISLMMIPVLRLLFSPEGLNRYQAVGAVDLNHKRETIYNLSRNYFKNFSPQFLGLSGDSNSRSHTQFGGELLWVEIFLGLSGLIYIARGSFKKNWLFLGLLLISPLPVAITKESPHALRGLTMIPFLVVLALLGMKGLISLVHSQKPLIGAVLLGSFFQFSLYYLDFENNYSKFAPDWQYGYSQVFKNYGQSFANYKHVYISDYMAQPYIFYLFYGDLDYASFRKNIQYSPPSDWGFSTVRSIGNVEFIKGLEGLNLMSSLVFASQQQRLDNVDSTDVLSNPDGSVAFYVYDFTKK